MSAAMSTVLLEAKGLNAWYGAAHILFDVDLSVNRGEVVALMGRNGAGKSTTLKTLMGMLAKRKGAVSFMGHDVSRAEPHDVARRGLGYVPEDRRVFADLTVMENLALVRPPTDTTGRHAFSMDDIFDLFPRLAERRSHKGGMLSGGERQMVAVSRALRAAPKVLLLDEPSAGLAPRLVYDLLSTMRTLVDRGLSLLLVEQNVRATLEIVDELYLLERGHVFAKGAAATMKDDPRILEAYLGSLSA